MDLSSSNIARRAREAGAFFAQYWLIFVIVIGLGMLAFSQFQSYLDRRAIQAQNEKLEQLEREKKASQEQTQEIIDSFNQTHTSTLLILDGMSKISDTVTKVVENDRRQDAEMIDLKGEYLNARNPKNETKQNAAFRANRRALPVRQREQDVLSADAELYPNAGN